MAGSVLPVLKGMATYVLPSSLHTRQIGGTESARYCYSVYLRHLCHLSESDADTDPSRVAELGPGASIGIGLAALIAGAERYDGLDIKRYDIDETSRQIFDELVTLFRQRTPIPDDDEFPDVKPRLSDYGFPQEILNEPRMERTLQPDRLDRIRQALSGDRPSDTSIIRYVAPWTDSALIEPGTLDWIFSQAVMEHVDDLETAYATCAQWLKPGAGMSHQIDFRSHGTASEWNGHWGLSDMTWSLMRGRRPYLINRQPLSAHLACLGKSGFTIVSRQIVKDDGGIPRSSLAPRFRGLDDDDFSTSGAFVIAKNGLA